MINESDTNELYKRLRPQTFKEVVGQTDVLRKLSTHGKEGNIPHAMLFTGSSGTGKTTIIRILRKMMGCSDIDYTEINGSDNRKIDDVRRLASGLSYAARDGKCKVYAIDECHALTTDAQNALLKYLEDPPPHVYWALLSSEPQKLKRAIITRCTEFRCRDLTNKEAGDLIKQTLVREKKKIDPEAAKAIIEQSMGSAREVMVLLDSIINLPVENQLDGVQPKGVTGAAFDLVKVLMPFKGPPGDWAAVAKVLSEIEDEEPEGLRKMVLSICRKEMIKNGPRTARAAEIIEEFRDNWHDSPKDGLTISCWNVVNES